MAKKLLTYEIDINASPEKVWHTMLDKETYEQWTAVFSAGSTYEGSWEEGAEIHFRNIRILELPPGITTPQERAPLLGGSK